MCGEAPPVPLVTGGSLQIVMPNYTRTIRIAHVRIEQVCLPVSLAFLSVCSDTAQDSGKSVHDQHPMHTYIDLNRAGVGMLALRHATAAARSLCCGWHNSTHSLQRCWRSSASPISGPLTRLPNKFYQLNVRVHAQLPTLVPIPMIFDCSIALTWRGTGAARKQARTCGSSAPSSAAWACAPPLWKRFSFLSLCMCKDVLTGTGFSALRRERICAAGRHERLRYTHRNQEREQNQARAEGYST